MTTHVVERAQRGDHAAFEVIARASIGRRPSIGTLAATSVLLLVSVLVLQPRPIVLAPQPTLGATESAPATSGAAATSPSPSRATAYPAIATAQLHLVIREDLGFEVAYADSDANGVPSDVLGDTELPGLTFQVNRTCQFEQCARPLGLTSATINAGVPLVLANRIVRVMGGTNDEIAASFEAIVGRIDIRESVEVGGEVGVHLLTGSLDTVFAVHAGRIYAIETLQPRRDEFSQTSWPRVFAAQLHFITAGRASSEDPVWFQVGLVAHVDPAWTVAADGPGRLQLNVDRTAPARTFIQAFGATTTAAELPTTLRSIEDNFLSLEPVPELWYASVPLGRLGNADVFVRPAADPVVFFVHGTAIYTVTAHVDPADVGRAGESEDVLRAFMASIDGDLMDGRSDWKGLRLNLGTGWTFTARMAESLQLRFASPISFLGQTGASFRIDALAVGTHADLPTNGLPFKSIGGRTLAEVARSIEAALGDLVPQRADLSIAGSAGIEWEPLSDAQGRSGSTLLGDTRALAIVVFEHDGLFYVVRESGVEGALHAFLDSITFTR